MLYKKNGAPKLEQSLFENPTAEYRGTPFWALNMPANLENSAVATGRKRSVFISIPKKGNAKECSNYCTIVLISHASKVMLKIL